MGRDQFLEQLTEQFPEVVNQIGACSQGLLHCEMADFRKVVETAMGRGELWRVENYLRFVDHCREAADAQLANAIDVSFLEDFGLDEFTDARRQAIRGRMPPRLREQVVSINSRWR